MDLYSILGPQVASEEPLPPETAPGTAALRVRAQPSGAESSLNTASHSGLDESGWTDFRSSDLPQNEHPQNDLPQNDLQRNDLQRNDFQQNAGLDFQQNAGLEDGPVESGEGSTSAPAGPSSEEYSLALRLLAEDKLSVLLKTTVERIRYITNASGIALALCETEDDAMVCRAGSGPAAPEAGARMYIRSGITAESLRTRQTLRCDHASTDSRVNRESCKALGIESVMVMPVVLNRNVVGMFQLFGSRPSAFSERDATALRASLPLIQAVLLEAVSAGVPLGRIPWAEEALPAESEPQIATTVLDEPELEGENQESDQPATLSLRVAVPIDSFRKAEVPPVEPGQSGEPEVPAFLARLADEARPAPHRTWSQWFRPQW